MKTTKNIRIISFLATLAIVICHGTPGFGAFPVYRLYNTVLKVHLYSTDANEKAVLEANSDWNYEGVAWYGYESDVGQYPVYRLYSPGLGKHLFTMDVNEKNVLAAGPVWQFEKIAWYANATPYSGDITIYRLYSDGLKQHLYTADYNEAKTLNGNGVWVYEGVAYYTLAEDTPPPPPPPTQGLKGEYYNLRPSDGEPDNIPASPTHVRIDSEIHFNWGTGSPAPNITSDNFYVKWTGYIYAEVIGTYVFAFLGECSDNYGWERTSHVGFTMKLNEETIFSRWSYNQAHIMDHSTYIDGEKQQIYLEEKNKWYPITVEIYDRNTCASPMLHWIPPGANDLAIIPSSVLKPD